MHTKTMMKPKNILKRTFRFRKMRRNKWSMFLFFVCFCFVHGDKNYTERSGLRIKNIFLLCIYGNQDTNMLHCFVVQNVLVSFLLLLFILQYFASPLKL